MHTHLHHLVDAYRSDRAAVRVTPSTIAKIEHTVELDPVHFDKTLTLVQEVPLFVIDEALLNKFSNEDLTASLNAMQQSGNLRLPFPTCVVEMVHEHGRDFGILFEERGEFYCQTWELRRLDGKDYAIITPILAKLKFHMPMSEVAEFAFQLAGGIAETKRSIEWLQEIAPKTCGVVGKLVLSALVLLNVRGIAKEHVTPDEKLNRVRRKRNRALIPAYSVIRVGRVYDASGSAQNVSEEHVRKSPRLHIRRAHLRNVRTGKGRTGVKQVLIDAVLVNYDPATGERAPQKRYQVVY